jgi:hypothetical protein
MPLYIDHGLRRVMLVIHALWIIVSFIGTASDIPSESVARSSVASSYPDERIPVLSPSGKPGTIPKDNFLGANREGYELDYTRVSHWNGKSFDEHVQDQLARDRTNYALTTLGLALCGIVLLEAFYRTARWIIRGFTTPSSPPAP